MGCGRCLDTGVELSARPVAATVTVSGQSCRRTTAGASETDRRLARSRCASRWGTQARRRPGAVPAVARARRRVRPTVPRRVCPAARHALEEGPRRSGPGAVLAGEYTEALSLRERACALYGERDDRRSAAEVAIALAQLHGLIYGNPAAVKGWVGHARRMLRRAQIAPRAACSNCSSAASRPILSTVNAVRGRQVTLAPQSERRSQSRSDRRLESADDVRLRLQTRCRLARPTVGRSRTTSCNIRTYTLDVDVNHLWRLRDGQPPRLQRRRRAVHTHRVTRVRGHLR